MAVSDIDPSLIVNEQTSWAQYLWRLPEPTEKYRWDDRVEYMYSIRAEPVPGQGLPPLPPMPPTLPPFAPGQQAFLDGRYIQTVNGKKADKAGNVFIDTSLPPRLDVSGADQPLDGSADFNNLVSTGFYRVYNGKNGPSKEWFYVIVQRHDDSFVVQDAIGYTGATEKSRYLRQKQNGTWSGWTQVSDSGGAVDAGIRNDVFGRIPAGAVDVGATADLNTLQRSGWYLGGSGNPNSPYGGRWLMDVRSANEGGGYTIQRFSVIVGDGVGLSWERYTNAGTANGAWSPWVMTKDTGGGVDGVLRSILGSTERIAPLSKDISGKDLNGDAVVANGWYIGDKLVNAPNDDQGAFYVRIQMNNPADSSYREQTAIKFGNGTSSVGEVWVRYCEGNTGGWSTWRKIADKNGAYDKVARDLFGSNGRLSDTSVNVSGQNFDDLKDSGWFRGNNMSNGPLAGQYAWHFIQVVMDDTRTWGEQRATVFYGGDPAPSYEHTMYVRWMRGGSWGAWKKVGDEQGAFDPIARANLNDGGRLSDYGHQGSDCNDLIYSGFYRGSGMANAPAGNSGWQYVFVESHDGSNWVKQTATLYASGDALTLDRSVWVRQKRGGTWDPWVQVADKNGALDATARAKADLAAFASLPTARDLYSADSWNRTRFGISTTQNQAPNLSMLYGAVPIDSTYVQDGGDLGQNLGDDYVGQLRTIVRVAASKTISLTLTHDDGAQFYVDGKSVYSSSAYTQGVTVQFTLNAGWHIIDWLWAEQAGGDGIFGINPTLRSQVDEMFAPVSLTKRASDAAGAVKTVNGTAPDSNGNVTVSGGGGGGGTGTVNSVNGKSPDANGAVTLAATDVGAVATSAASNGQVHAKNGSGTETGVPFSTDAIGGAIAQRDSNGQVNVATTPTTTNHATSKQYVDNGFAPIARTISTGSGLQGGGNLSGNRQLSLDATAQSGVSGGNKFNAQVFVMDGNTTTDALNTFLAQGGYRSVTGTVTLTKPLIIPGGTVLDAYGATFNGVTTDNTIANAASVPRVTATGSSTAGSNTITATTGIFSASDVGRQVQLLGAGPNAVSSAPGSWYGTITAVASSTSATVDVPANLTTSGKTLYLYGARDANIIIMGGTWNVGNKNSISQTQQSHGFRLRRVDRISVIDATVVGTGNRNVGGQYSISFGDTNHVITRNLRFVNTNSDGIHFQGPARDILVDGVQGVNTGDDLVAFTGVDGQSQANSLLGDTEGDITDVEVHNVYGYDVWTHLKITGGTGPGGVLRNISRFNASGIYGNAVNGAPVNIVDYAGLTSFSGKIAEIYAVGSTTATALLSSTASNVKSLTVDGVYWPATNVVPATGMVVLGGTIVKATIKNCYYEATAGATTDQAPAVYVSASSITYLDVDGTFATNPATQTFCAVLIASALVATRVSVVNHHSESTAGNAMYFTVANWNIKAINFDRVWRKMGAWIDGTASSTSTAEITATNCSGGTAWVLLRQTATILIAGCVQSAATGAGIRMIGASAYATISVSGSSRNTTLVSKDSTQNLRIIECTCIGVDATLITVVNDGDLMRFQNTLFIRSNGAWKAL